MTFNLRHGSLPRLFRRLVIILAAASATTATPQGLPELSDSATLVMNQEQEKLFGKQVMLSVRAQSSFSDDILLQDYFTWLTGNLARNSPRDFGAVKVGLAIDPAINAFALPGGYITVNTGLIQNARNEAELASVIAHEIGHQSQRHISRRIERSKQLTLPATAAMLGGLLLGGQVGTAAIVSTQAAVASDQLSYSRTFEREADATGMSILAATGYDPQAMPAFFNLLEAQSRLYGGLVLEFLNTHPVSSDRIADGRSRAASLESRGNPPVPPVDRLDFDHARARTLARYDEPVDAVIERFKHDLNTDGLASATGQAAAYGLTIAYARSDQHEQATSTLRQLRAQSPDNPVYRLAEAELASFTGDNQRAVALYAALYNEDRNHPAYQQGYAQALVDQGDNASAIQVLRKVIRRQPEAGWAYGLLSQAYAADGKTLNAALTDAQRMKNAGYYNRALELLNQQIKQPHADSSDYLTASINSLIQQIEEEKRQMENFKL